MNITAESAYETAKTNMADTNEIIERRGRQLVKNVVEPEILKSIELGRMSVEIGGLKREDIFVLDAACKILSEEGHFKAERTGHGLSISWESAGRGVTPPKKRTPVELPESLGRSIGAYRF